jgi:hypothetical protein
MKILSSLLFDPKMVLLNRALPTHLKLSLIRKPLILITVLNLMMKIHMIPSQIDSLERKSEYTKARNTW